MAIFRAVALREKDKTAAQKRPNQCNTSVTIWCLLTCHQRVVRMALVPRAIAGTARLWLASAQSTALTAFMPTSVKALRITRKFLSFRLTCVTNSIIRNLVKMIKPSQEPQTVLSRPGKESVSYANEAYQRSPQALLKRMYPSQPAFSTPKMMMKTLGSRHIWLMQEITHLEHLAQISLSLARWPKE